MSSEPRTGLGTTGTVTILLMIGVMLFALLGSLASCDSSAHVRPAWDGSSFQASPTSGIDEMIAAEALATAFGADRGCVLTSVIGYYLCEDDASCEVVGSTYSALANWACYLPKSGSAWRWACVRNQSGAMSVAARRRGEKFDHHPCRGVFSHAGDG